MALKYNNQAVNVINYNGNDVKVLVKDGVTVWCKPFSLSITNGSYGTVTRTATNEPSASTGDLSNGSIIYYGDTLTATPLTTTAQYSYTVNTSSLTVDGNESFTFTRTLRSYTITLAKGGSNYGSWSKTSMTAYYGDKIALSGNTVTIYQGTGSTARDSSTFTNSSATGYTYSVSYGTVPTSCTGAATITATTSRTANTYTLAGSVANGAISFRNSSNSTITQAAYDSTIKVVVNPNAHYEYVKDSTRYYNGSPYVIASITLNTTNFTMSDNTMTVKNATVGVPTLTEITYTYSMSSSNSTYCYYGASAPNTGNTTTVTSTWANRASTTVYYKINPNERYYCHAVANYHDHPYSASLSGDNFTFTDSNKTATHNKACTALEYTLTATSSNGTVTVGKTASYTASITGTYADLTGRNIYYKITPSSYYYYSSATYTNSNPYTATLAGTGWSYSDANRTATKAFTACSAFNYTIQEYTRTGGTVTWCTTSGGTYSTTLTAAYGSTVYWKFTPSAAYNAPSTASGNMTLNSTNFTLSTSTAAGNATYKGSAIGNGTRKSFTVYFNKTGSEYGSWSTTSATAYYGDYIQRSGSTVTIYKWDATSTARASSTFTNGSATGYTYSANYLGITPSMGNHFTITYSGSGGGGFGIYNDSFTVSPSTTYTYSCYLKASDSFAYTHANFLYTYQYNSGTYVTEGGIFTTSKMIDCGNGWYRIWNTITTSSSTNNLRVYFYTYPGKNVEYWIGGVRVETGSTLDGGTKVGGQAYFGTASGSVWGGHTTNSEQLTFSNAPSTPTTKTQLNRSLPYYVSAQSWREANTYTLTCTANNCTVTYYSNSNATTQITQAKYDSTVYCKVTSNRHYYYSYGSYSGTTIIEPRVLQSTAGDLGTFTASVIHYHFICDSDSYSYCYYGATAPSNANTTEIYGTYAEKAGTTLYYKINPLEHYYCNDTSHYHGVPYSGSAVISDAAGSGWGWQEGLDGVYAYYSKPCTPITYTLTATSSNGTVTVSKTNGSHAASISGTWDDLFNRNIYYKITPSSYYYYSNTTYTNSNPYTSNTSGSDWTYTDSNQKATRSFTACTPFNYTIQEYTRTGGTVTWSTSQNGTYSATLTAAYGSTVYWKFTADTAYNAPSTASGSMALTTSNFSFTTSTAAGNATYTGSAIGNGTRKTLTVTFSRSGSYGSWSNASLSCQYGDQIQRSGDTVTIYKWDATSTSRGSSTFTNGSATGYTYSLSYTNAPTTKTVINNTSYTVTATTGREAITYTLVAGTVSNGAMSFRNTSGTAITQAAYDSTVRVVVNPNSHYEYVVNSSTRYYHDSPYTFDVTLNTTNFSLSGTNATKNSTGVPTLTEITYTYSVSSANSAYCYYGATAPSSANTTAVTGTYAQRANKTIYYKINPNVRYYCNSTSNYNGVPYSNSVTGSSMTFYDSSKAAIYAKDCTAITYTLTATSTNGVVTVGKTASYSASITGTYSDLYNRNIYVKIVPDEYYYGGSASITHNNPYTGTHAGSTWTYTDSNQKATQSFAACSPFTYTIQEYTRTGGTVTWCATSNGTYTSTLAASYKSTVYWKFNADTAYNAPSTASGSMTLNSTNFTLSTTVNNGTATYKGSAIGNGTRKTLTVSFALGGSQYGSWSNNSITGEYGDQIQLSGNKVTLYKWNATSTERGSSTFTNGSATGYTYNVSYSGATGTKTAVNGTSTTVTATTSRTIHHWTVRIKTEGIGTTGAYLSTSSTATSADSGATVSNGYCVNTYDYNTTVYGFTALLEGYDAPSAWSLVSGTANTTGAKYKITSVTVPDSDVDFNGGYGYAANIKQYTLTITKDGNTSTIYYKVNGASSWSSTTSSTTVTINYGTAVYYYVTPATGYTHSYTSSSNYGTVSSKVTGNLSLAPTPSRITGTFYKDSITGVSSYTCYRKLYNGSSWSSISNGATLYYGDKLYFIANPSSNYIVGYYQDCSSSSDYYTCNHSQGASLYGSSFVTAMAVSNNILVEFPYVGAMGEPVTYESQWSITNDCGYNMTIKYLKLYHFRSDYGEWEPDAQDAWDTYGWTDEDVIINRSIYTYTSSSYSVTGYGTVSPLSGAGGSSGYYWNENYDIPIYIRRYEMKFFINDGDDMCYHMNETHYFTPQVYVTRGTGIASATFNYIEAGSYTLGTGYTTSPASDSLASGGNYYLVEFGTSYSVSNITYNSCYESNGGTTSGYASNDYMYLTISAQGINYTLSSSLSNCTIKYYSNSARTNQITSARYGTTVYYTLTPNQYYKYTYSGTSYYYTSPRNASTTVGTGGYCGSYSATAITYTFSVVSSNAAYVYYNTSGSPTSATTITGTHASPPTTVYYKINPNARYYCYSTSYINGTPYYASISGSNSSWVYTDSAATAKYTRNCTAITYTYSMPCTNGVAEVGTTNGSYSSSCSAQYGSNTTIYFRVTPNSYYKYSVFGTLYTHGRPYTATQTPTGGVWVYNDSNKTATIDQTCTAITYTVYKTITGGYVYWNTSSITTSGGTQTSKSGFKYGDTVYWRITNNSGYVKPNTYYGSVTLNATNFPGISPDPTEDNSQVTYGPTSTYPMIINCSYNNKSVSYSMNSGTHSGNWNTTCTTNAVIDLGRATRTNYTLSSVTASVGTVSGSNSTGWKLTLPGSLSGTVYVYFNWSSSGTNCRKQCGSLSYNEISICGSCGGSNYDMA